MTENYCFIFFLRFTSGLEEDLDSPLYASPTAYGYAKIGEHRIKSSAATSGVGLTATNRRPSHSEIFLQSTEGGGGRSSETQILAGFERGAERTSEFTFGHTGHMDIILGRGAEANTRHSTGLFENIKEKAKHGFSATKRNFL